MTRNKIFILLTFLILISCNNKASDSKNKTEDFIVKETKTPKNFFQSSENATLEKWIEYYKTSIDSDFTIDKFEKISKNKLSKIQGNIYGIFDKEFDTTYTDFLIYSPNKQNYVDIDSYQWILDKENEILFDVDQEINLVNIPNKNIERIAFRGPMGWVEDAYWKNDSTVVLLETTTDKVPIITQVNIYSNESITFVYQDTLKKISKYSNERIFGKLNN